MEPARREFRRLYEAADAFLARWGSTDEELLEQHEAVRDLLEPMLQPAPPDPDEDGHRLGDFRLLREIGRGGMGVVYEAWQTSLNRRVALKVLPAHVTLRKESVARFRREAKSAARLEHPGIVDIHAIGCEEDTHYFAMELVEGAALDQVLARVRGIRTPTATLDGKMLGRAVAEETLPPVEDDASEPRSAAATSWTGGWVENVVRLVLQVADAMEHAHRAGVIHRDVKPSNILVREDGTTVLTDFGLAREIGPPSLTMTGDFAGTPHYVSPEQAAGRSKRIDQRSDVFALGTTLYELLTLKLPFSGGTVQEVFDAIASEEPVDPQRHNPKLAPDLAAVVLKALEKDPERRYQSAQELADDLHAFLEYRPVKARRTSVTTRVRRYGRRLVRRHPAVAGGVSVALVALATGAFLFGERGAGVALEYDQLCTQAEAAIGSILGQASPLLSEQSLGRVVMQRELQPVDHLGPSPRALYAQAIDLMPGRPEAWFGRALAPGSRVDARLDDLQTARTCGLSPRTFHLARAYLLAAGGRGDESEKERALAAGHPSGTPADAYFEGILQHAAGNRTQALELLTRAVEGSPRESSIRYRALRARSGLRRRGGDWTGALADLHVLLDQGDDSTRVMAGIAMVWWRLEKVAEAERWFEKGLRQAREYSTVSVWVHLCIECRGRLSWFDRATEEALACHPDVVEILHLRATALQDRHSPEEALRLGRRALDLVPTNPGLHHSLAITLVQLKRYPEALDALDRAIELDDGHVGVHRNRGNVLSNLGRFDEALRAFDRAECLDPASPNTYISRGAMLANDLQRYEEALEQFDRAVQLVPRNPSAHANRVVVLRNLRRYEEALEAADQALAVAAPDGPARGRALARRARVLQDLKRSDEALAVLEDALRIDPKEPRYWSQKALALSSMGRHAEALDAVDEAIRLDQGFAGFHRRRAWILRDLKRFDAAADAFAVAVRLDPDDVESRRQRGALLHNRLRRHEEALAAFEEALELDPDHATTWFNKAIVLQSMQRFEEAIDAIDEAIQLEENNPELHSWRGVLLHNGLRRNGQALAAFEQALRLDPKRTRDWHSRAVVLRHLRRYDAALEAIDQAILLEPNKARLHVWRGELLNDHFERHQDALVAFTSATRLKPRLARAHRDRGIALKALERYGEAIQAFDRALAINERDAHTHFMRGASLYLMKNHEEAAKSLARAVELDPKWAPAHGLQGSVLVALGKPEEALACFALALELTPEDPRVLLGRGQVLADLGRHETALRDFESVIRLRPENTEAHYRKGRCLHALHRYKEAIKAYDVVLERDPGHDECRRWHAEALRDLRGS